MRTNYSVFDYTITISRKHRYLVIGCPEFGFQLASECVTIGEASPGAIGEGVMRVLERISGKLHELSLRGETPPVPLNARAVHRFRSRQSLTLAEASAVLGLSKSSLRKAALRREIQADRTPGGHLRFTFDMLADYAERQKPLGGVA